MRTRFGGFEDLALAGFGLVLLAAAGASVPLSEHLHPHNLRVLYGLHHLPAALFASFAFLVAVGVARPLLTRAQGLSSTSLLVGVVAVFCLFWLPTVFAGSFDADDWMLLAAASVRRSVMLHPWLSWRALDSVDGNFRPLGTVLYMGGVLQAFGLAPRAFLAGLFLFNLLAVLVIFPIVREMGYSRVTAVAAAVLYLSRSVTYTLETWVCALGDTLVILLCGVMAWALLRAIKRPGAAGLHVLAWCCFFVATLAKQSAFAVPLIVAVLLYLRPGMAVLPSRAVRVKTALLGLATYGAGAAFTFFHAKSIARGQAPYPMGASFETVTRTFAYVVWYLGTFEFPPYMTRLALLPALAGGAIVAGVVLLVRRVPRVLGARPRDVVFCLLAAGASVSLFLVLATRGAAYYSSMAAFWISIALAIGLTRFGAPERENRPARVAALVFCGLVVTGFTDVRLKQTGLLPSGGYTWGTSDSDLQWGVFTELRDALAKAPEARTLVLTDMPGYASYFTSMAIVVDPGLERMVTFASATGRYSVNDLGGRLPRDGATPLSDAGAYNWNVPLDTAEAARLTSGSGVLRLRFHDGKVERED